LKDWRFVEAGPRTIMGIRRLAQVRTLPARRTAEALSREMVLEQDQAGPLMEQEVVDLIDD
jgi:hypothetical protein